MLLPRAGWRDPEVRVVVRPALPSLAQAGLLALQVLTLLALANRLPGGIVAFQIALNFYYLAIALGATPVALSLLPRLSRMHLDGDVAAFRDTLVRGLALGFFITIPAAVGYLALAVPLARAISFGKMGASGVTHGRRLARGAVGGGRGPDRVHDRHLRVVCQEGHPVAAAVDDGAGDGVPRPGERCAARARPGRAPHAGAGPVGGGYRRGACHLTVRRVARSAGPRNAAARAFPGQVRGWCPDHGRARLAHSDGRSAAGWAGRSARESASPPGRRSAARSSSACRRLGGRRNWAC